MSQSPSLTEVQYNDSARVLKDLIEILGEYEGSQTKRSAGDSVSLGSGETAIDTLKRMEDVINAAKTTQVIPNKAQRA